MSPARRLLLVLYGVAALTGQACSIVWMKRLTLVMGGTLPAVGAVLAVVLTGYAIGALGVGRFCRDDWNVARRFAWIQAGLGIWLLGLPVLFDLIEGAYAALAPPMDTAGHWAVRVALVIPVLLPPSAAMGAVFPLVSAAGVSRVFAMGVVGSLAGVMAGTLLFLPGLGIEASLLRLGMADLAVAAAAWMLPAVKAVPDAAPPEPCGRACVQGAILGLSLFFAEFVWFRLVFLVVDQTAYAEGLVLGAVFLGMAVGARLAYRPKPALPAILFATAAAQLILIPGMVWLARAWNGMARDASFTGFLALEFLLALGVVGLPSIGYGLAVPRICEGFRPRAVGRIWAAHYLGGMVASLSAPMVVIPVLGETATLGLASAALALPLVRTRHRWPAVGLLAACAVASLFGDATFRETAVGDGERILLHHADGGGLVEVYERIDDGARTLLSSRRRQEGGDQPEQVDTERRMGRLPLQLHAPHPSVLVIGLGTGVTVGAMLEDPAIERLTCVEISEGVLRAARLFSRSNGNLFEDPRLVLVLQDGRNFVRLSDARYDLLMQELFFPYRAGVGALYTTEHYRRCRDRLRPGGRAAQWISLAQIGPEELRTLVRTFQGVFPHTSVWRVKGYLLMLGGDRPLVPGPEAPFRHFVAADAVVAAWTAEAQINTEDNLLIEYQVPRMYRWLNSIDLMMENLRGLAPLQQDAGALSPGLPEAQTHAARRVIAGILEEAQGGVDAARREYRSALALDPENPEARERLDGLGSTAGRKDGKGAAPGDR